MRVLAMSLLLFAVACASTPAPPPQSGQASPLRIVSWNLEHLAEQDGEGCRPRASSDYQAIATFVDALNADIIAFQEVENERAAARVFDPNRYQIFIETRSGSGRATPCRGMEGVFLRRQATGFAVRRGLAVERHPDLVALQAGGQDLRSGVDITVSRQGLAPIRLLSVHLKSGCAEGSTRPDCPRLFEQIPILEAWIDARASESVRFAVLGDFNRRLSSSGDSVWADLDDGVPLNADLSLAAGASAAHCDPRYSAFIDHIVLDLRASADASNFQEWRFDAQPLSDHCPVSMDLAR